MVSLVLSIAPNETKIDLTNLAEYSSNENTSKYLLVQLEVWIIEGDIPWDNCDSGFQGQDLLFKVFCNLFLRLIHHKFSRRPVVLINAW